VFSAASQQQWWQQAHQAMVMHQHSQGYGGNPAVLTHEGLNE
jgi:hypothetical protein